MRKAIATVTLSGDLYEKFEACAAAGYQGVEIFENDLMLFDRTPEEVRELARSFSLDILSLQPLRDFEALPEETMKKNLLRAARKFELMQRLGAQHLLVCSNTSAQVQDNNEQAAADLARLAEMGKAHGIAVGYSALAWGRHVNRYEQAWEIVRMADHSHLGLVVNSFHLFAAGSDLALLQQLPLNKLSYVQLADAPSLQMETLQLSRHFRCFPGQGDMPVLELMACLQQRGYRGYISHEIFNDDFRAAPPKPKAVDGMRSMLWMDEQLARQSEQASVLAEQEEVGVLPPQASVDDLEFIEFAIDGEEAAELTALLTGLGFEESHRHRSKDVSLWRQGQINLVLNHEMESMAHSHFLLHGVSVCALGFSTRDLGAMLRRAEYFLCPRMGNKIGPGELNIPAVRGVGDSVVYFVEHSERLKFYDVDFFPLKQASTAALGLTRIDHIAQTVNPGDFLSASFFYKSVFGFEVESNQDLFDLYGTVVSRTITNADKQVRIPLNMSANQQSSSQRFLRQAKGSGIQQIAFACDDIFHAAEAVDRRYVLPIPANYYTELAIKYDLDEALVSRMQALNILYDRNDDGEFFHLYTREVHGVFFEILQRAGGYDRYGEVNSHVRMGCQSREYRDKQRRLESLLALY